MTDTPVPPDAARQAVAGQLAAIDLTALPDPELHWWSSSVSENHPGKRYHRSRHCEQLWKIKDENRRAYTRAYSAVATQICWQCASSTGGDAEFVAGRAAQAIRDLHERVLAAAVTVDDEPGSDTANNVVADLARRVRSYASGPDGDDAATAAFTAALNALTDVKQASSADDTARAAFVLEAACYLSARASVPLGSTTSSNPLRSAVEVPPESAVDLRLLDRTGTGSGSVDRIVLRDAWAAFRDAAAAGQSLEDARTAALAKLLPLEDPTRLGQLPERIDLPAGTTAVTVADLIAAWRPLAEKAAVAVVDGWVVEIRGRLAELDAFADVTVVVPPAQQSTWQRPVLDVETDRAARLFPARIDADGTRTLTVPVVVAAWLERTAERSTAEAARQAAEQRSRGGGGSKPAPRRVLLADTGDETIGVARTLLADTTGHPLSLVDALRGAYGIAASPQG